MREKYSDIAELEIIKDTKTQFFNLGDAERHKLLCERILQDECLILEKEEFSFTNKAFKITPLVTNFYKSFFFFSFFLLITIYIFLCLTTER